MTISTSNSADATSTQSQNAFKRWDNEGGALPGGAQSDLHQRTNAELLRLRVRVMALENMIISLLSEGADHQQATVRDMAGRIAPRAEGTQQPLRPKSSDQLDDMVNRAQDFRSVQSS